MSNTDDKQENSNDKSNSNNSNGSAKTGFRRSGNNCREILLSGKNKGKECRESNRDFCSNKRHKKVRQEKKAIEIAKAKGFINPLLPLEIREKTDEELKSDLGIIEQQQDATIIEKPIIDNPINETFAGS